MLPLSFQDAFTAREPDFDGGAPISPTSVQLGPDGRLYVAERFGGIRIYDIDDNRDSGGGGTVALTLSEIITAVKTIPNHNDQGELQLSVTDRQVTGLFVAEEAGNPVLYVTSSDPRTSNNEDLNLDTNSGILSKLTPNGSGGWDKVDLVRGLPRSEENHAPNGLQVVESGGEKYALVAIGGFTNAGAPSPFFANTPEYVYAGTIVKIDLDMLESMPVQDNFEAAAHPYVYDLPTLNDPTRGDGGGEDTVGDSRFDVFGGNDGRNMAVIDDGGPVEIFATGFRNSYDLVYVAPTGEIYATDNGANANLGGFPIVEDGVVTNQPVTNSGDLPNVDHLHRVEEGGHHGHAIPILASGAAAGLPLDFDASTEPPELEGADELPIDFTDAGLLGSRGLDPAAGLSQEPTTGQTGIIAPGAAADGALYGWGGNSTNGIAYYSSSALGGAFENTLITASFEGEITALLLSDDGTEVIDAEVVPISDFSGSDVSLSRPLDVFAIPDGNGSLSGSIVVVQIAGGGGEQVVFLTPDGDGVVVDDGDEDDDGLLDVLDPFQRDPTNGFASVVQPNQTYFIPLNATQGSSDLFPLGDDPSEGGTGLTGAMIDGVTEYRGQAIGEGLISTDNTIFGGAFGGYVIGSTAEGGVTAGTAQGGANTQDDAAQFGFALTSSVSSFAVTGGLANAFREDNNADPQGNEAFGIQIGAGDQANYLSLSVTAQSIDGELGGFQVLLEEGDSVVVNDLYSFPDILNLPVGVENRVELTLSVDRPTLTVTPKATFTDNSGSAQSWEGDPVAIDPDGTIAAAMAGSYQIGDTLGVSDPGGIRSGLAAGVIATSQGGAPFDVLVDDFTIETFGEGPFSGFVPFDDYGPGAAGEAIVTINSNDDDVQTSNFGGGSFTIANVGDKRIAAVFIDVTPALYPDSVFDPFGEAGDTLAKELTISSFGGSGVQAPVPGSEAPYVGVGGEAGYEGLILEFSPGSAGGFASGETMSFAVDMDPNSIRGFDKGALNADAVPFWDTGGISGAELTNSTVTVLFGDGSTKTADLINDGSQGGSHTLVSQAAADVPVTLTVNGFTGGAAGSYGGPNIPQVAVSGPAGETVRVVLTKGVIQPQSGSIGDTVAARLAGQTFQANNAAEFQVVDVVLDGGTQDISDLFDYTNAPNGVDLAAFKTLPLGFVAAAIDPATGLPKGPVTNPIYVESNGQQVTDDASPGDGGTSGPGNLLYAVNAGGDAVPGVVGTRGQLIDFEADNDIYIAAGGENTFANDSYGGTGSLIGSERWDPASGADMLWQFDVPGGTAVGVDLYFAEIFPPNATEGGRVFDVSIEGEKVLDDFDISTEAALGQLLVKSFNTTVGGDNEIDILFEFAGVPSSSNTPKISAIAVYENTGEASPLELILIDATSGDEVSSLIDGTVVNLATTDVSSFTVIAASENSAIESVAFELTGPIERTQLENVPAYALFGGDGPGSFGGEALLPGSYTLTAIPYPEDGGGGPAGTPITVDFTVVESTAPPPDVVLFDALAPTSGQDEDFAVTVSLDGATATLTGNTWVTQALDTPVEVTAGTVARFQIAIDDLGEIQGIGFDDDAGWTLGDPVQALFKLAGTDSATSVDDSLAGVVAEGDGFVEVEIALGAFAGELLVSHVHLINDQDGAGSAAMRLSGLVIEDDGTSPPPPPPSGAVVFDALTPTSGQDEDTLVEVSDDGTTATLSGNTWVTQALPTALTIAADTVARFEIAILDLGEIQGIGFDDDAGWSLGDPFQALFKLAGTDDASSVDDSLAGVVDVGDGFVEVEIGLGGFAGNELSHVHLINDQDGPGSAGMTIRNLVVEGGDTSPPPPADAVVFDALTPTSGQDEDTLVEVSDDGTTATLTDNTWVTQALDEAVEITADTVARFEIAILDLGEIQGIGFDDDAGWSLDDPFQALFKLAGTDDASSVDDSLDGVVAVGDGFVEVTIALGGFAGNDLSHVHLINDHDDGISSQMTISELVIGDADLLIA